MIYRPFLLIMQLFPDISIDQIALTTTQDIS